MSVVAQREGRRVVTFLKCGHTSVINMFMTSPGKSVARSATPAVQVSNQPQPTVYKGFSEDVAEWPEAKVTVAVFRDPLARAASAYQHFIVRTLQVVDGLPTAGRKTFTELGFDGDMTFPDFCQHLAKVDRHYDMHIKPQAASLREASSGLVYGVQLEQLAERWPVIVKAFDLPCTSEVAQFNAANYTYDSDHWSCAYLKETYAEDYKLWERAYVETRAPLPSVRHAAPQG